MLGIGGSRPNPVMSKKAAATKAQAKPKPKAPESAELEDVLDAKPAKPKAKPNAKTAAKPNPKPKASAKPAAAEPAPPEETLSPEDTKIREYFKNPNVTFTGVYRAKILEWIAIYEELGTSETIWREPKKVWKDTNHPAYASWSGFVEGLSNYDVQQLMNAAYENQQNAMLEMLACWFAIKLSGLSTDQMIREIQQ